MPGLLFTFEGGDGAGKTTQLQKLEEALSAAGHPVRALFEPGTTPLGSLIRGIVKQPGVKICPEAELFLFQAARAQMVRDLVLPLLRAGTHVILDRFIGSTWVYQGWVRGVNLLSVEFCNRLAAAGVTVNRTWVLDVPAEVSGERLSLRGNQPDRFEQEGLALREKVRQGYLELARTYPDDIIVVDGSRAEEEVHREILQDALRMLAAAAPSDATRIPLDLPMAAAA
jgi:dTMP kinase